jgi:hypothetical protein
MMDWDFSGFKQRPLCIDQFQTLLRSALNFSIVRERSDLSLALTEDDGVNEIVDKECEKDGVSFKNRHQARQFIPDRNTLGSAAKIRRT